MVLFICYEFVLSAGQLKICGGDKKGRHLMNLYATRRVDDLGRIVLPMELRKKLQIDSDTDLDIYTDGNERIVLKKASPACKICGSQNNLTLTIISEKDVFICANCKHSLQKI